MSAATSPYAYVPLLEDVANAKPPGIASTPHELEGLGSCIHCRRRKVRCDKKIPCANCVRLGFHCELAPRKRAPRRPRKDATSGIQTSRETELLQRLNALETTVKTLGGGSKSDSTGITVDEGISEIARSTSLKHGSLDTPSTDNLEKDFGLLLLSEEGQSRYVNRNFFARLNEEVDNIRQMVYEEDSENENSESPQTMSTSSAEDEHQSYVFGYSSSAIDLREFHPLPSQLPFFIKMYAQKVDPVVKMLHMPSVEKLAEEAQSNLSRLTRSKEALLFSIYFAVAISMSPLEIKSTLGFDKDIAINRYQFGTEQALARANFLETEDSMILQAFVLYLTLLRVKENSRKAWTLTRSAIGIGQSLGLHRDGTMFDLSPFEVEMRRRLWWHLFILDFRMAEKHGTEPSIIEGSFDTKRPLNINDADISPDHTVFPEARVGLTEMTLTLISSEIAFAAPNLLKSPKESNMTPEEKEERIDQYQQLLQERYVKHCTELTPVAWIASVLPRLIIAKMKSIFLLPYTRSLSKDEKSKELSDKMFVTSIEVVELRRMLEAETTKHWHWYLGTIVQWHCVAYLLSELCVREPDHNVTRAWNVLDLVFKDCTGLQQHGAPAILKVPMKKLIARARHKRALDLETVRDAEAARAKILEIVEPPQYSDMTMQIPAPIYVVDPPITSEAMLPPQPSMTTDWVQQQDISTIPTPWLLDDTALQDLGFEQAEIGPDMDWELNNWIQDFAPSYSAYDYQLQSGIQ